MKKKSMVPRNFIVTAAMRQLAEQNHWPNPDDECDAFIDHHRAKGSLFVDIEAAFRTWLRNAARWRNNGKPLNKTHERRERTKEFFDNNLEE
jgi:hypothetical protein